MKLLDKLILKDLVPFFLTGITLFSALYFAADPLLTASRYLSQGAPFWLVVHIVSIYLPTILGFTLPMGMLLAVLQGFGRLSGDSEGVALYAGGIPFTRIVLPAIVMGIIVSGIGYVISDNVSAYANQEKDNLQQQIGVYIHNPSPSLTNAPIHFEKRDSSGRLQATIQIDGGINLHTSTMRKITIVLYAPDGQPSMIVYARSGVYGKDPSNIYGYRLINVVGAVMKPSHAYFQQNEMYSEQLGGVLTQSPEQIAFLHRDPLTLTFAQARRQIAVLAASGASHSEVITAETTLWSRIALPFSALVFTVIGAPLGLRPQRSSRMTGWFLAILIVFGYYVLMTTMNFAAQGGLVPPAVAAFIPHFIGLAVGGYLVWRASR